MLFSRPLIYLASESADSPSVLDSLWCLHFFPCFLTICHNRRIWTPPENALFYLCQRMMADAQLGSWPIWLPSTLWLEFRARRNGTRLADMPLLCDPDVLKAKKIIPQHGWILGMARERQSRCRVFSCVEEGPKIPSRDMAIWKNILLSHCW